MDSIQVVDIELYMLNLQQTIPLTDYVLNVRTGGYFIGIRMDKYGGRTHVIGIDISKKVVYDSMEKSILKLNNKSLNKCCGQDQKFSKFDIVAELIFYQTFL